MEKQMKEEKTMEENKKKNPDNERKSKLVSAILMAFVCVVMMGGGTYAWFTMSNTARVNSLKLNVAAEGNLRIAKANKGDYANWQNVENNVTWYDENETVKTLYPCTADTSLTMKKPLYSSETNVKGLVDIDIVNNSSDKDVYYLEQKFYLFMDEGENGKGEKYNVCLVQNGNTINADDELNGTYFTAGDKSGAAANCARVSFQAGEAKAVYEPNSDVTIEGIEEGTNIASTSYGVYTPFESKHKQSKDGAFTHVNGAVAPLNTGDSDALFTITGNTPTEVTVRVWFEGTDDQCYNEIQLKNIVAQLKFVANKATTTQTPTP